MSETKTDWTMPSWMEPYREDFVNTGGNSIEELMDDLDRDKTMVQTNVVRFVLAVSVSSQVGMLTRLHEAGRLISQAHRRIQEANNGE